MIFSSKSDFSIKIELKNWVSGKYFFSKIWLFEKFFIIKNCRNEKFSVQNLTFWKFSFSNFHCAGKRLLQNLITFFLKISFQSLIFNEKVFYKIMLFKMSTQSEKLVVGRWANRVKTLCLRRYVFIEICFLDLNWTQKLIFRKFLYLQNDFSKSLLTKSAKTKNSRFKNWSNCRKKLHFKIRTFFQNIPFQNPIFNGKVYFKIMPFQISTQSEKLVVVCGANWVKTFFFRCEFFIETWFLKKNWIQKLSFWKTFLPQKKIIRNVLYSKSAGTKKSQFKIWHFGIFSFQISIVQENVCFRIWFLFFWKLHFKLWFSMKNFSTKSCFLKWARKVKNLLLAAEQIESKRYVLDVMFLSKSGSSI